MIGFPNESTSNGTTTYRTEPVFSDSGMVAAAHPLVSEAGAHALRQGGNAVDAAVAAGLTASVVMPEMCGLGGDLFAIVHAPGANGAGKNVAFLGSGISPKGASIDQMRAAGDASGTQMPYRGPLAVGVPGMVDAYFSLLDHFGSRPFAGLAEPAIGHAKDGFTLTPAGASHIATYADLLGSFPDSRAVFLPDGTPLAEGETLRQSDLATTLQAIADGGRHVFYRGDVGQRIARYMAENGGAITLDDLSGHSTTVEPPIETTYRGHTVYQTGLPTQGLILLEALNIVANTDLANLDLASAEAIHLLVEAKKLAYADRLGYAADPAFSPTPLDTLLSASFGKRRFADIDPDRAATDVCPADLKHGDTTYLCVVDRDGMMVSLIQSVSAAFGAGVVAGDTGVVLNNRVGRGFSLQEGHPNIYEPGKKTMHTLNCYMIADPDGTPVLVGGTPGGDGQPQWNLQTITGLIDGRLDVQAAIEQPRWTSWPGTDPSIIDNPFELRIEDRVANEVFAELEGRGHNVRHIDEWASGGAVQVIARDPATGALIGGSDPRAEGKSLGA
ncbi:MAG: gamma-glutamyltransferase [Thermomicrobiales bacterium]